jgi:hypothetical protein
MPIQRSHGEARPQNYRADEMPPKPATEPTGADKDPHTGRFVKANRAARRRKLKALAKHLPGLDPDKCAAWLAPSARLAGEHAGRLIGELPAQTAALNALAADTAIALAVHRGLLSLGAQGDMEALAEARAWFREHRQSVLALTGLSRDEAILQRGRGDPHAELEAALAAERKELAK